MNFLEQKDVDIVSRLLVLIKDKEIMITWIDLVKDKNIFDNEQLCEIYFQNMLLEQLE